MNIQTEKLNLVEKLLQTKDKETLARVRAVFESSDEDFWEELPVKVQEEIEEAIQQADRGELIPHETVMKKYSKWLSK